LDGPQEAATRRALPPAVPGPLAHPLLVALHDACRDAAGPWARARRRGTEAAGTTRCGERVRDHGPGPHLLSRWLVTGAPPRAAGAANGGKGPSRGGRRARDLQGVCQRAGPVAAAAASNRRAGPRVVVGAGRAAKRNGILGDGGDAGPRPPARRPRPTQGRPRRRGSQAKTGERGRPRSPGMAARRRERLAARFAATAAWSLLLVGWWTAE